MKNLLFWLSLIFISIPVDAQNVLKDICPGDCASSPTVLFRTDSLVYFSAYQENTSFNTALWATDGTAAGTRFIKDLTPNSAGTSFTQKYLVDGDKVYFTIIYFNSTNSTQNIQLWVTDGTTDGTIQLHESNYTLSAGPNPFIKYKGKIYFMGADNSNGAGLWTTDGTVNGTSLFKSIEQEENPNRTINNFFIHDDILYFNAYTKSAGNELWISDGTDAGTKLFIDFFPGPTSGITSYNPIITFKNHFYFIGLLDPSGNYTLCRSDYTLNGSKPLDSNYFPQLRSRAFGTNYHDDSIMILNCVNNQTGEIWVTDGTDTGFYQLKLKNTDNYYSYLQNGQKYNDKIIANIYTIPYNYEPMLIDCKNKTFDLILDVAPGPDNGSSHSNSSLIEKNGRFYFMAFNPSLNTAIWRMDPMNNWETEIFYQVGLNQFILNFFEVNGHFLLIGNLDLKHGTEIYNFDEMELSLTNDAMSQFHVYPNPIHPGHWLNFTETEPITIELYDSYGRLIETASIEGKYLIPETISSGLYFIKIKNESIEKTVTIHIE